MYKLNVHKFILLLRDRALELLIKEQNNSIQRIFDIYQIKLKLERDKIAIFFLRIKINFPILFSPEKISYIFNSRIVFLI